jgi:hypothetical protein
MAVLHTHSTLNRLEAAAARIERLRFYGKVRTDGDSVYVLPPPSVPQGRTQSGLFPVLVRRNGGDDGTTTTVADYTYDLYPIGDTAYASKLNGDPVAVTCSRARVTVGRVNPAPDGSVGLAYRDTGGNLKLFDVPETRGVNVCAT